MTNNRAGITDGVTAHIVRGTPDIRQRARDRVNERILGAINDGLIGGHFNLLAVANNETAEAIIASLEALGWSPPKDTPPQ